MVVSKKNDSSRRIRLNNALKKNGAVWRRFIFNGLEADTGRERMFFVELEMVNPFLSPDEPVLGFKERTKISEEDFQYVLAGTKAVHELLAESFVNPSYIAVRAGIFGQNAKQLCSYYPVKQTKGGFRSGNVEAGKCIFTDDHIRGEISCSSSELYRHPEYFCDSGVISWDLQYEILYSFPAEYTKKTDIWIPVGARTAFAGTLTFDGHEYHILSKTSGGYIDLHAGRTFSLPWIHMSSSTLTSLISGRTLFNSCFAVHGLYENQLAVAVTLEENSIVIKAGRSRRKVNPVWECTQMPADEEGEKLHWSVSADTKKWVIDIDIMCLTKELFVRNIELPEGGRKMMKQLAGGTGTGEIRLYHHVGKKNLELIEDAHIANALCEFGQLEMPEK
jgi:tocopherol cyclase